MVDDASKPIPEEAARELDQLERDLLRAIEKGFSPALQSYWRAVLAATLKKEAARNAQALG